MMGITRGGYSCRGEGGQALVIALWIILALSVLALSISHTAGMELRIYRSFASRTRAYQAARAGIAAAVTCLLSDPSTFDGKEDAWADNEPVLRDISLSEDGIDRFSVAYISDDGGTVYGIRDLDGRIDINSCDSFLLSMLLPEAGIPDASAVEDIINWRGGAGGMVRLSSGEQVRAKSGPFNRIEELALLPSFENRKITELEKRARVSGDGLVNLNTADDKTIRLLARAAASRLAVDERFALTLAGKIIAFRLRNGTLRSLENPDFGLAGAEELNIFNALRPTLKVSSRYFLIESTGRSGKMERTIEAVYDRDSKAFASWHES